MPCRFCEEYWAKFWEHSTDWERAHSNEGELWAARPDAARKLIEQAAAITETDPEAALQLYIQAAEEGCVFSMEMVGWHYDVGNVVPAEFLQAQHYYYRALQAGSWMATIRYARLLEKHGYHDFWPRVLEDGVRADFIPAFFWLARFRFDHARSREQRRSVRPLLEYAAEKGHPAAYMMLGRSLMWGKFGLSGVPRGLAMMWNDLRRAWGGEQPTGFAPA